MLDWEVTGDFVTLLISSPRMCRPPWGGQRLTRRELNGVGLGPDGSRTRLFADPSAHAGANLLRHRRGELTRNRERLIM